MDSQLPEFLRVYASPWANLLATPQAIPMEPGSLPSRSPFSCDCALQPAKLRVKAMRRSNLTRAPCRLSYVCDVLLVIRPELAIVLAQCKRLRLRLHK
jgi:hypothetical protein